MILTWNLPNGPESAPMLSAELRPGLDAVADKWGDLCKEIGDRHQLPEGWLIAMIWRESAGNERAYRVERRADGTPIVINGRTLTGVGLMQITSPALKRNRTDAELFNPALNIELGASYIAELASRPDTKGDFPRVCAAFNAGSVRDSSQNRWGMVMTKGHVDAEVSAYNYWLSRRMSDEQKAAAMAAAVQFSELELLPDEGSVWAEMADDNADPAA